jgi:DNA processing protein
MSEREARLGLNSVTEPGDPQIAAAVQQDGAEQTWDRLVSGALSASWGSSADRALDFDAERVLDQAARAGARFVIPGDPEWPAQLVDLAGDHLIHDCGGVPLGLWITGSGNLAELLARSVTIVGSRACTTYGEVVATELAQQLSTAGHTVVSGGAYGIDAAAHRGALAAGTPTVVVLASGVDRPHPPAHRQLFARVAERGVIVSEAEPGAYPTRARFLARARILAALTQGTVLVEAAVRSGSLNTVRWANDLGRATAAVPGPVTSVQSSTPHRLIRDHGAVLVTDAADLLMALDATPDTSAASMRAWEHIPSPAPGRPPGQPIGPSHSVHSIGL